MLKFYSYSTRIMNTARGVAECLESSMGQDYKKANLLVFHASLGHEIQEIMYETMKLVPGANVVAASCCGTVGKEGVSESMKDLAVMAIEGSDYALASCDEFFGHNAFEKCQEMAISLKAQASNINMLYFLGSGIDTANDRCIAAFEEIFGPEVTIFGATSSDNMKGVTNYQGVNGKTTEHGAFVIGFADPSIQVETQATHGFTAIGDPMIVTKSEGHIIKELNGKPAWNEYTYRLGLQPSATCGDTIPIGALGEELPSDLVEEYGNRHILRVVTKHENGDMYYATEIKEGTKLWLTTRDEELIFSEMDRIVNDIKSRIDGKQPVAVFHADCLARGRFLFNRIIKEELVGRMQFPFYIDGQCPPWLGMYGFGEFARLGGKNEYHNYTTALYVLYR